MPVYLTPTEIIAKYPDIEEKFGWGVADLGFLLKCDLLKGYYSKSKRVSLIQERSLLRLICFHNDGFEAAKASV